METRRSPRERRGGQESPESQSKKTGISIHSTIPQHAERTVAALSARIQCSTLPVPLKPEDLNRASEHVKFTTALPSETNSSIWQK